jgi:drug/metabolite transporter (DMT)-like permease
MPKTYRPLAAAFWMSGSIGGFSVVAVSGRALSQELDTFEVMLYRSLIGLVVVVAAAVLSGRLAEISTRHFGSHILRNCLHFAGQNLWLFALGLIPLAQLFALEFSYPIIVALAAPLILSERLTPTRLIAAAVGFAGILIVARPFGVGGLSLGIGAALLCALGFAGAALATKRLTRVVSITCILFWLVVMQSVLGLACAGSDGHIALPSVHIMPWVLAIGLAGLGAHYCLTKALSLAPATIVVPIDFLRLPLISVVGMALYNEPLDHWVFIGGSIIFAANWINLRGDKIGTNVAV